MKYFFKCGKRTKSKYYNCDMLIGLSSYEKYLEFLNMHKYAKNGYKSNA